jgi:hypothetical protein
MNTNERDAEILRKYKKVGDAKKIATEMGMSTVDVLRTIHAYQLQQQISQSSEVAQAIMDIGQVVFALPANAIQTSAGANALISNVQSAIRACGGDMRVMIAVAVIPVEEITINQLPLDQPHAAAASLQSKTVNRREICNG